MIVALALFALIGVAGFSMLNGVLDTQHRTDGRLRRLSEIQRAVFVIGGDLDQISGRVDGDAGSIIFQKIDMAGRPAVVRYDLREGGVVRTVSGPFGERTQPLLSGVQGMSWSYHQRGLGWSDRPPAPQPQDPAPTDPDQVRPPGVGGVQMVLRLTGVDGRPATLRRVVRTPEVAP